MRAAVRNVLRTNRTVDLLSARPRVDARRRRRPPERESSTRGVNVRVFFLRLLQLASIHSYYSGERDLMFCAIGIPLSSTLASLLGRPVKTTWNKIRQLRLLNTSVMTTDAAQPRSCTYLSPAIRGCCGTRRVRWRLVKPGWMHRRGSVWLGRQCRVGGLPSV